MIILLIFYVEDTLIEGKNTRVLKSILMMSFFKILSIVFGMTCEQKT